MDFTRWESRVSQDELYVGGEDTFDSLFNGFYSSVSNRVKVKVNMLEQFGFYTQQ